MAVSFWNQQQPLKTEVYTAHKDRGPATVPPPPATSWPAMLYPELPR